LKSVGSKAAENEREKRQAQLQAQVKQDAADNSVAGIIRRKLAEKFAPTEVEGDVAAADVVDDDNWELTPAQQRQAHASQARIQALSNAAGGRPQRWIDLPGEVLTVPYAFSHLLYQNSEAVEDAFAKAYNSMPLISQQVRPEDWQRFKDCVVGLACVYDDIETARIVRDELATSRTAMVNKGPSSPLMDQCVEFLNVALGMIDGPRLEVADLALKSKYRSLFTTVETVRIFAGLSAFAQMAAILLDYVWDWNGARATIGADAAFYHELFTATFLDQAEASAATQGWGAQVTNLKATIGY
jgi:hypothetical protein